MIIAIIAVFVLLLLSAFFSGSETALTGASRAYMVDKAQEEKNHRAQTINKLLAHKDKLIITTLLGSNLCNTLSTALSTSILISLFGNEGVAYATIIMTVLVLIYTDMLPKSYAIKNANQVSLWVAPLIRFCVRIFSPLTYVLQKVVALTFRLVKLDKKDFEDEESTIAEIRGAIYMYGGQAIRQEKEMLKGILDLTQVQVNEVMNHRQNVFSVDIDLPVEEIIDKVKDCPFSRIPLYKDRPENIIGIIRVKSLLRAAINCCGDCSKLDIRSIMYEPWFIPETTNLLQQLQLFRNKREHFAIVVDEYGDLQGIITLEDILEEIVGEINDESDIHSLEIMGMRRLNEQSWIIDGQVPLRDLNRRFGWHLCDNNASTLAGYLMDAAQIIPEEGQKFIFDNIEFEILKRRRHQIHQIKVTPLINEKL